MYTMHDLLFEQRDGKWLWEYVRNVLDVGYYKKTYLILMEFTGLKDRNGKEVYEGDIVQYDAIDVQGVITWINNGSGFFILNPEQDGVFVFHSEWEIIGNIYEHPALLKEQSDVSS